MKLDSLIPAPLRKPAKPGMGNGAKGPAPADLKTSPPERPSDAQRLGDRAKEAPADVLAWVDQRTAATGFLTGMLYRKVPKGTNWFYTLGSATLIAFIAQAITGVFLAMFYTPSTTQAYASIAHINNDVFLGQFVHGMHKWGSSVMVILIFLPERLPARRARARRDHALALLRDPHAARPRRDHRHDRRPHVPGGQARHHGAALVESRQAKGRRPRLPARRRG
jgi:hypothetical protein